MPHPIENIMQTSMEQLRDMVDVNTVVGQPITTGNKGVILPVSKVSLGFVSGGGEYTMQMDQEPIKRSGAMLDPAPLPFAGAAAAGMSLTPVGFLFVDEDGARLLPTAYPTPLERLLDTTVPQALRIVENLTHNGTDRPAPHEAD